MYDEQKIKQSPKNEHTIPTAAAVFGDEALSDEVNEFLSEIFNKNSSAYDRAIDAAYVQKGIGSSVTHHITDGSHTFWGAFKAADGALPNDTHFDAAIGAFEHLMRDFTTKSGINPTVSINPENLEKLKDTLEETAGISRSWANDILTVNVFEAVGALLSLFGAVYGFRKGDYRFLGKLVGSSSWASVVSANPLMAVVAVVTAIVAWRKAGKASRVKFRKHAMKGGIVTAVITSVSSMVGGPAIIGVAVGLYAGYLTARKLNGKKCNDALTQALKRNVKKAAHILAGFALRVAANITK